MYDVNVFGVVWMVKVLLVVFECGVGGYVVFIGSIVGLIVYEKGGGYVVVKYVEFVFG